MKLSYWLGSMLFLTLVACDNKEETFMVGTLERDRVEVSVESNEPIIAVHAIDGQMLKSGELILEQNPVRLQGILAQQTALRDQAAAHLAELQRGPRPEIIRQTRAQLTASQALSQNAANDLKRARDIFERGLSNQASLDAAQTAWETAVASEHATGEALESQLNGTTMEELQQAQAALDAANARVGQVQLDLARLKVRAPVSGMLDKLLYQLGERPKAGSTIAVILDEARTFARIYVPESQRAFVHPGKQLDVRIDGVGARMQGTVLWVSSDASFTPYFALTEHDRSKLSYLAKIDLPTAADLPAGLPLEVDFPRAVNSDD